MNVSLGMNVQVSASLPWQHIQHMLNILDPITKLIDCPRCLHRFRMVVRDEAVETKRGPSTNRFVFDLEGKCCRLMDGTHSIRICISKASSLLIHHYSQQVFKSTSTSKLDGGDANNFNHCNWMEAILSKIYEQLMHQDIPWQELVSKFSDKKPEPGEDIMKMKVSTTQNNPSIRF